MPKWPVPGATPGSTFADLLYPHRPSHYHLASQSPATGVITFTPFSPSALAPLSNLLIKCKLLSNNAAETDTVSITFNADTGSNYDVSRIHNANTTVTGVATAGAAAAVICTIPGASATAGVGGILEIEIPYYNDTAFFHTFRYSGGYTDYATAGADGVYDTGIGTWRSAAAITSVQIQAVTGTLTSACYATMYATI